MDTDTNIVPFPDKSVPPPAEPFEISLTEWLETYRYLEGRPISFNTQPWLRPMLECPDAWQVWRTGRQVAKSTSIVNLMLAWGCNYPYVRMLYAVPTHEQLVTFSGDRLHPAITESPPIAEFFFNPRTCRFRQKAVSLTTPAFVQLVNCFESADTARGTSAHILFLDEVQDLPTDAIPVLEETLSAASRSVVAESGLTNIRRYCGTPKTFDTALEKYWELSSQNEWVVPCTHCGGGDLHRWNILDENNIGEQGLVCKRCGKDIHWPDGEWTVRHPGALWTGWRVSQLMATEPLGWIEWKSIIARKKTYPAARFQNEVLGLAYDQGTRPVTLEQVKACCQPPYHYDEIQVGAMDTFAGLDWQMDATSFQSFTVLTIYALIGRRFQLQYVKKFVGLEGADPNYVLQFIQEKIDEYSVRVIGCDHGVGHKENQRLREALGTAGGDRVIEFMYVSMAEDVKWDPVSRFMKLDRTRRMEGLFEAVRQKWVWWPRWDLFEEYYPDIQAIYADYNTVLRKTRYLQKEPDDFFHSTLYAWEAFHYYQGYNVPFWRPRLSTESEFAHEPPLR